MIDTATNSVVGSPSPVAGQSFGVDITPYGTRAYVTNPTSGTVSVIDTATNTMIANPIPVGQITLRRGYHPQRRPVVCRQSKLQHRVGDRHRDQHRPGCPGRGGGGPVGVAIPAPQVPSIDDLIDAVVAVALPPGIENGLLQNS